MDGTSVSESIHVRYRIKSWKLSKQGETNKRNIEKCVTAESALITKKRDSHVLGQLRQAEEHQRGARQRVPVHRDNNLLKAM